MTLWCYVIEQAADDETIGAEAQGQETLDVPTDTSSTTRPLTDTTPAPSLSRAQQSTLDGDTITDTNPDEANEDLVKMNAVKDPTRPSDREIAASHPAQARLSVWTQEDGIDTVSWDVDTSRSKGEVSRPTGRVYYPADAPSASPGQATLTAFTARQWRVTVPG
ncbi:hypothetical protein OB955_03730 [Halobacteria archaeon AArc-m2/3/4]|uniref:Uncharacterized protein n=1 Tax=Natronoglomus mannanivorans TaxID=2979990 RepID=A0ABT2QAC3_9EURY|nr:hypothetical protein [Halobacteria archaeon AArc-m2/3/4]